jgi:hypothetical protein
VLFAKVCDHCGADDPVRIPLSTTLWTGGGLAALLLACLLWLSLCR